MKKEMPEQFRDLRYSHKKSGANGLFWVPSPISNNDLKVIVSDGMEWDHVSVSLPNRCPNWIEMSHIKDLFFDDSETVVQFHPKKSEYVNCHPNCLHLWRSQSEEHKLPPTILTGFMVGEMAEKVEK